MKMNVIPYLNALLIGRCLFNARLPGAGRALRPSLLLLALLSCLTVPLSANVFRWQGDRNNNYGNDGNWSQDVGKGDLPGGTDTIILSPSTSGFKRYDLDLGSNTTRRVESVAFDTTGTNAWQLNDGFLQLDGGGIVSWKNLSNNTRGVIFVDGQLHHAENTTFIGGSGGSYDLHLRRPLSGGDQLTINTTGGDDRLVLWTDNPDLRAVINIQSGSLVLLADAAVSRSQIAVGAGGQLLVGVNETIELGTLSGRGVVASLDGNQGIALRLDPYNQYSIATGSVYEGVLNGDYTITTMGGADWTLTGANQLTAGYLSVDGSGPLTLSGSGAYYTDLRIGPNAGTASNRRLNIAADGITIGQLSGYGQVNLDDHQLTLAPVGATRFDGSLLGSTATVILDGPGSLELTGDNSNRLTGGQIELRSGQLIVNNNSGSATGNAAIEVGSDAWLGGRGAVAGSMVVESGGSIRPGDAATTDYATLRTGPLELQGSYLCELGTAVYDRISVEGDLNLGTDSELQLMLEETLEAPLYLVASYTGTRTGSFNRASQLPGYTLVYDYVIDSSTKGIGYLRSLDVASITASTSGPARSVQFEIRFTEPVQSFDLNDLQIDYSGMSAGTPVLSAIDGATYTLSFDVANGLAGEGNLSITVLASGDIEAVQTTAPLSSSASSETVRIDLLPPVVSEWMVDPAGDPTNVDGLRIRAVFSEAVNFIGGDLGASARMTTGSVVYGGNGIASYSNPSANPPAWLEYDYNGIVGDGTLGVGLMPDKITDAAGNTLSDDGLPVSHAVTIDNTAPVLERLMLDSALSSPTSAGTLIFELDFSEAVNGLDAGDFEISFAGSYGAVNLSSGSDSYVLTVSNVTGSDDFSLSLTSGHGIIDLAGNALSAVLPGPVTVSIDQTAPVLQRFELDSSLSSPTKAQTLVFELDFSEPVDGLDSDDFVVNYSGGYDVLPLIGSGSDYVLTVSNVTGDGDFTLSLKPDHGIVDLVGYALSTPLPDPVTVMIDQTAPVLERFELGSAQSSSTNAGTLIVDLDFSEAVRGLDASDFEISFVGSYGTVELSNGSDSYELRVYEVSGNGEFTVALISASGIVDLAGNGLSTPLPDAVSVSVDQTAPVLERFELDRALSIPTKAQTLVFELDFSEPVGGLDADDFAINFAGGTWGELSLNGSSSDSYELTISGVFGDGALTVSLTSAHGIVDFAGNSLATPLPVPESVTVDQTAPVLERLVLNSALNNPTNAETLVFELDFSEAVRGLDTGDFEISFAGTHSILDLSSERTGSYLLTIGNINGDGDLMVSVKADHGIADLAGNPLATSLPAPLTVTIDQTEPILQSLALSSALSNPTNADTLVFDLSFSEAVSVANPNGFIVNFAGGSYGTYDVSGSGDGYQLTISGVSGDGEFTVSVTSWNNIFDLAGNPLSTNLPAPVTVTVDQTAPVLERLVLNSALNNPTNAETLVFELDFSEAVRGLELSDLEINFTGTGYGTKELSSGSDSYELTVYDVTGNGDFTLSVSSANGIVDLAGNTLAIPLPDPVTVVVKQSSILHFVRKGNAAAQAPYGSWATAAAELQDALAIAVSGDTIWVAQGTYLPGESIHSRFNLVDGVALYGGFAGSESSLAERDPDSYSTVLSGDLEDDDASGNYADNARKVVYADEVGEGTRLDGFSIVGGYSRGAFGPALFLDDGANTLQVANCTFADNRTDITARGGAVFVDADAYASFENCLFEANTSGVGGALYAHYAAGVYLVNCHFRGNNAYYSGGAMACYNTAATPGFTLIDCVFSGNRVTAGKGGGLHLFNAAGSVINSSFSGNAAETMGGALFAEGTGLLELANTLVWGNLAVGQGDSTQASLAGNASVAAESCLIEHWSASALDATGSGNLDGTRLDSSPVFAQAIDPADAPSTAGDLRLGITSLALDAGNSSRYPFSLVTALDAAGSVRLQGSIIDIGAYEGPVAKTPQELYAHWVGLYYNGVSDSSVIGELADPDNDGLNNVYEYALGLNPALSDATGLSFTDDPVWALQAAGEPYFVEADGVFDLYFTRRLYWQAAGLSYTLEYSDDLESWLAFEASGVTRLDTDVALEFCHLSFSDYEWSPTRYVRLRVDFTPAP